MRANSHPMVNPDEESKSDGLEILSVGTLYSGPWDKKYWSSSRGKERYPYPIGYQALRIHKGLTYKMEISEGPKGPKFQIISDNKQSGSGDTPDRAREDFQKKCCSRIKLWHGKRFSGKVDVVEFFGFKNALVQRLLRELVATLNDASEQSSLCDNFNEDFAKSLDTGSSMADKCPDLMSYLGKNRVTGKRNQTCKGVDLKSADESSPKRCQLQEQDDETKVLDSTPPKTNKTNKNELMNPYILKEDNDISRAGESGTLPVSLQKGIRNNVIPPALVFEASEDTKVEPFLAKMQRELPSMETCKSASSVNSDIQGERPLDAQLIEIRADANLVTSEDKKEKAQVVSDFLDSRLSVLNDSQANYCVDLYAPDTLDTQQEIASPSDSGDPRGENSIERNGPAAADMIVFEEPVTGPHSEDGNCYLNGNSERSDFDSAGEELTKSMMKVLLPLLTYSSRKRKRKAEHSKVSPSGKKLENELNGTVPSPDVICPVGSLGDPSLEVQTKGHASDVCIDRDIPLLKNIKSVVPDSLDDQFEGHLVNQVPSSIDNAEAVTNDLQKGQHEPSRKGSSVVLDANDKFYNGKQTNEVTEVLSHEEPLEDVDELTQKYASPVLHPSIGCASTIPVNPIPHSNNNCLTADVGFMPLDDCSERSELGDAPTSEGFKLIPLSGEQQSIRCDTIQDQNLVVEPVIEKYSAPLSESIIYRKVQDTGCSEFHATGKMVAPDSFQWTSSDDGDCCKTLFGIEGRPVGQLFLKNDNNHEDLTLNNSQLVLHDETLVCKSGKNTMKFVGGSLDAGNSEACVDLFTTVNQGCESANHSIYQDSANCVSRVSECQDDNHKNAVPKQKNEDEVDTAWKLIGCYLHPVQISSVILTRKSHEIDICVSCGPPEERKRDLFLYKIDAKEPSVSPSMVAYTSVYLPILKDEFDRQVAFDKIGVQFTPDATGLVIVDSIRTPYCREKNIHCLCPQCESCCFEENAIKIVHVKLGYVSVVLRLKTIHPLQCVLVCEPEHIIALDQSGIIYIWVMHQTWSVHSEEYIIPSYEFLLSRLVELKRIPRSASMVIGHNGLGEFSLWDITKRAVVSRFSAPTNSVLKFVPVSLFNWKNKGLQSHNKPVMGECVKKLLEATMSWFSVNNEANVSSSQMDGKNIAVWLFVSTTSDPCIQSKSCSDHEGPEGCWRLGLLIKKRMILGAAVPPSTSAIGTAAGHGIIGTNSGHAYIWDLATATEHKTSHDVAEGGVSHIFADDSTSSAVAIARNAKLWIYVQN